MGSGIGHMGAEDRLGRKEAVTGLRGPFHPGQSAQGYEIIQGKKQSIKINRKDLKQVTEKLKFKHLIKCP